MSEDLTDTLLWDLTDRTQESNEQWEVGQTYFIGKQVFSFSRQGRVRSSQ